MWTTLMTFPMERQYLAKERAADMYRLSAYYLSSTISDCLAELIYPTIFMFILYFMAGLRRSVAAFVLTLLATYLIGVTGQVTPMKPSSPLLIHVSEMLWSDQLSETNIVDFYNWTKVGVHLCECKHKNRQNVEGTNPYVISPAYLYEGTKSKCIGDLLLLLTKYPAITLTITSTITHGSTTITPHSLHNCGVTSKIVTAQTAPRKKYKW